jgi:hypothetical protein
MKDHGHPADLRTPQLKNKKGSSMSHLAERFADAVRTLVSDGPIKMRLTRAFAEHLQGLDNAEFPLGLRSEFNDLQHALSRIEPVGSETRVRAAVQKMSPLEAGGHADTIVRLYVALLGQTERAEPLKVVSSPKKPPRYLTNRS